MRDERFKAIHRGGLLLPEQHRELMVWAIACAKHVLPLCAQLPDDQLVKALEIAQLWNQGSATVGEARKAAVACHALARESTNPVAVFVIRAVGHAVATAHMADHALGPAWYALKAVQAAGLSTEQEETWQNDQIPLQIRDLVIPRLSLSGSASGRHR